MSSFKSSFLILTFLALTVGEYFNVIYALLNVKIANLSAHLRSLSTIKGGVNYYENN